LASTVLSPGTEVWTTDISVPISKLTECITETKIDLQSSFLLAPLVGHVGDGNFHLFILLDPHKQEHLQEAIRINRNLINRALRMEGTCTGEHGIGIGKREFLEAELGTAAVVLMKEIKRCLDPKNIMNPGKKLPEIPLKSLPTLLSSEFRALFKEQFEIILAPIAVNKLTVQIAKL